MFFLLSATDGSPPKPPDAAALASWDETGGWGNKGASLADPPVDGLSVGKETLWGDTVTGKDAAMLLKPGFEIYASLFTKDDVKGIVEKLLAESDGSL